VLPVRHCETILELSDAEAAEVMIATREVARAIDSRYRRPGIAVWQNNGIAARQAIPHVHVHIAGTLDDGGTEWGDVDEQPVSESKRLAEELRPYLPGWPATQHDA